MEVSHCLSSHLVPSPESVEKGSGVGKEELMLSSQGNGEGEWSRERGTDTEQPVRS